MKTVFHKAESRGSADFGWLKANHSFSFADYHNPERMGFGKLRVVNDDIIAPLMGFGTHPHNNMEIVTIPLSGAIRHKDTLGNEKVINVGEVQVMSAGSGISHSEFNPLSDINSNILQTWILPKETNIEPRYGQKNFDLEANKNKFHLLVSPDGKEGSLEINQDAYYSQVVLEQGKSTEYKQQDMNNGIYVFIVSGEIEANGVMLNKRDGLGITDSDKLELNALADANVLVIEVPMGDTNE